MNDAMSLLRRGGFAVLLLELGAVWHWQAQTASATPVDDSTAKTAAVPESWELSPYRIHVMVRVASAVDWPAQRRQRLVAQLAPRASALLGGIWRLTVTAAPAEFPWGHAAEPAGIGLDALPAAALDGDKLMLLDVQPAGEQIKLWSRELDVRAVVGSDSGSRR